MTEFVFTAQHHTLRRVHAALFGVNPWRLQAWLGHKRFERRCSTYRRLEPSPDLPASVMAAAATALDPGRSIFAMPVRVAATWR